MKLTDHDSKLPTDPVYTKTDPNGHGSNLEPCPYLLAFTPERIHFRSRLHWNGSTARSSPIFSTLNRILLQNKAKFASLPIRTRLGTVPTVYTRPKQARIQRVNESARVNGVEVLPATTVSKLFVSVSYSFPTRFYTFLLVSYFSDFEEGLPCFGFIT